MALLTHQEQPLTVSIPPFLAPLLLLTLQALYPMADGPGRFRIKQAQFSKRILNIFLSPTDSTPNRTRKSVLIPRRSGSRMPWST